MKYFEFSLDARTVSNVQKSIIEPMEAERRWFQNQLREDRKSGYYNLTQAHLESHMQYRGVLRQLARDLRFFKRRMKALTFLQTNEVA